MFIGDKMRKLTILALAICLFGLAASAQEPANSQTTDAKASKAAVYVYRYKQFVGSALSPSVWCDGTELDPGKHTFSSNDKQSGIELDAKAGQEYFVRVEIAAGMMKGYGRLILVAPEQGGYELKSKLKPLDSNKVVVKATLVLVSEAHPEGAGAKTKPAVLADAH
jgi:hypothetical protein